MGKPFFSHPGVWFLCGLCGAVVVLLCVWVLPVAGFHHTYVVGIFGWLFVNGEDPDPSSRFFIGGREYVPSPCGLPLSLAATAGVVWLMAWWYRRVRRTGRGAAERV